MKNLVMSLFAACSWLWLLCGIASAQLYLSDLLEAERGESTPDDNLPRDTVFYVDFGTGAEGGFGRDVAGFFADESGVPQGWEPVDPPGIKFHDSERYEQGIGAHPDSRIDFKLEAIRAQFGGVNEFSSVVGIDELTRTGGSGEVFDAFGATFDVYLDDVMVGSYSVADGQSAPSLRVSVPLSVDDRVLSLRTQFFDLAEINTNHAAWAAAHLTLVPPAPLLGDYNLNGIVDAADYNLWRDTFGSTDDLRADGNGNGIIDAADYNEWRDNFGNTAEASVPEPSTLLLLLPAAVAIRWRRRRR